MKNYICVLVLLASINCFSQKMNQKPRVAKQNATTRKEDIILDYSKLKSDSLNVFLDWAMKEAYSSCQNYIPDYFDLSKDFILRSKILIYRDKDLTTIKNISEIDIKNKCNVSLSHSNFTNFNLNKFNPLIYRVNFLSNQDQLFRLYSSNYVLFIKGK